MESLSFEHKLYSSGNREERRRRRGEEEERHVSLEEMEITRRKEKNRRGKTKEFLGGINKTKTLRRIVDLGDKRRVGGRRYHIFHG